MQVKGTIRIATISFTLMSVIKEARRVLVRVGRPCPMTAALWQSVLCRRETRLQSLFGRYPKAARIGHIDGSECRSNRSAKITAAVRRPQADKRRAPAWPPATMPRPSSFLWAAEVTHHAAGIVGDDCRS